MSQNAILIHGWNTKEEFFDLEKPTASNDHWFPWLTKQLMMQGFKVDVPEMPQYDFTTYESWKRELERFDLHDDTILVGHSCGGGFLVRWLSEEDVKVGKVILVAPWLGYDATDYGPFDETFFDFDIQPNICSKTNGLVLMHSLDDVPSIQQSVTKLRHDLINLRYVEFDSKGHFTRTSLGVEEFPELLEEIIKKDGTGKYRQIVDKNNKLIGHKWKEEFNPSSDIYRVSGLWLRNSKGEVLLARRSPQKKNGGGLWGPAVAGTLEYDESYESNIVKEIQEEIGITDLALERGETRFVEGEGRKYFCTYFYGVSDLPVESFTVEKDAVEEVKWVNEKLALEDMDNHPDRYLLSMVDNIDWIIEGADVAK